ncbi:hypothetical protein VTL71DRAFT_12109 [Oculimacula yallundae]|uniref:Uncharacterized protein n=1 Tax=Oculimacula yallundae TaxID=86028 RepID=A0ABR4CUD6_9HELO
MASLQDLISRGRAGRQSFPATKVLNAISDDNVTDIKSYVRTIHQADGSVRRRTILTLTLDGKELVLDSKGNSRSIAKPIEPSDAVEAKQTKQMDTSTQTIVLGNMKDQATKSLDAIRKELEEFKKELEKKAEKRLQEQLDRHEAEHEVRLMSARDRFRSVLNYSLHAVQIAGPALNQLTTVRLPAKIAAEVIRHDSELQREYIDLCTTSLQGYQSELKRQYHERLDDLEKECKEWLQAYSSFSTAAINTITTPISKAREFEAQIPDVNVPFNLTIAPDEIESVTAKQLDHLWKQAQKDIEEGGMFAKPRAIHLDPLFDHEHKFQAGQKTTLVGVPAALLPLYRELPKVSAKPPSAALGIIERNKASRNKSSPTRAISTDDIQTQEKGLPRFPINNFTPINKHATSVSAVDARQTQEKTPQEVPTNNFTPINKPYISPYTVQPGTHTWPPGPSLVSSNTWYGPKDRLLADRTRGPSVDDSVNPCKKNSGVRLKSRNQSSGETRTSFPLAGIFTTHQHLPTPRRVAPTLIGPVIQVNQSANVENEIPLIVRPNEGFSKANLPENAHSTPAMSKDRMVSGFDQVDRSLYDADYDSDQDEQYVPPPALPPKVKSEVQETTNTRSAVLASAHSNRDSNITGNILDAVFDSDEEDDYVAGPISREWKQRQMQWQSKVQQTRSTILAHRQPTHLLPNTTPNQDQQHQAPKPSQQTFSILSVLPHSPTRPSSSLLNDTLRRPFEDGTGDLPENRSSDDGDNEDEGQDENEDEDDEAADAQKSGTETYINAQTSKPTRCGQQNMTYGSHDDDSELQGEGQEFRKPREESRSDFSPFPFSRRAAHDGVGSGVRRIQEVSRSGFAPFRYFGSTDDGHGSIFRRHEESRSDFEPFRFGGKETEDLYGPMSDYFAPESEVESESGKGHGGVDGTRRHTSLSESNDNETRVKSEGDSPNPHFPETGPLSFNPETHIDPYFEERDERPLNPEMQRLRGIYATKLQREGKAHLSTHPGFKREKEAAEAEEATLGIGDLAYGNAMSDAQDALLQQRFKGKTVKEILWMLEVKAINKKRDQEYVGKWNVASKQIQNCPERACTAQMHLEYNQR